MKARYRFPVLGLIILLISAFTITTKGQEAIRLSWKADADIPQGLYPFSFEGAELDYHSGLPRYIQEIPLPGAGYSVKYSLNSIVVEPADFQLPQLYEIDTDIQVDIQADRGQWQAKVSFFPFSLDPGSGRLQRYVMFEPHIEIVKDESTFLKNGPGTYAESSALASGLWYKLGVTTDGVYKITYQDLQAWGINPAGINPKTLSIHGSGGGMLSELNSSNTFDDLPQIAIRVVGEEDGSFDPGDYILFYGESPHKWLINPLKQKLDHVTNIYSDTTWYFLTYGTENPLRIGIQNSTSLASTHKVKTYPYSILHEKEERQMTKSGKQWWGEVFDDSTRRVFTFIVSDRDTLQNAIADISLCSRSLAESSFKIYANEQLGATVSLAGMTGDLATRLYARNGSALFNLHPRSDTVRIRIDYIKNHSLSLGYLDYIELTVPRLLRFHSPQMPFAYIPKPQQGSTPEWVIEDCGTDVEIWLISNPSEPKKMITTRNGSTLSFKLQSPNGQRFIAFDGTHFLTPSFAGQVANQNLHALQPVDYIIVTHKTFKEQAERLAQIHRQRSGLTVEVVDVDQIYNEFSSGAKDPIAIRSFIRMLWTRSEQTKPGYLLLFGDGSYDPKNRVAGNKNFIPAYQSAESLILVESYTSDDFYGLMDPTEGVDGKGKIDVSIGRFPVTTVEEAQIMVDKVDEYLRPGYPMHGPWRNTMCLVADDEDSSVHLEQAEKLAYIIDTSSRIVNVNKIYLDAFTQSTTAQGQRYPDVNKAITRQVNEGALFVNYTGHGGELGWAGEWILTIPEIYAWENDGRLPIFVTATCEFSRFDDPERVSAGEHVILRPHGGGVAIFTTTRIAFSQTNAVLNQTFYKILFQHASVEILRLGDLVRLSKNQNNNNISIRNFLLLGDPAIKAVFPEYEVVTTHINQIPVAEFSDTLKACQRVRFSGQIVGKDHLLKTGFNGKLYYQLFDKKRRVSTLVNDPNSKPWTFTVQDRVIAKGAVPVKGGQFDFELILPKDIDYSYGAPKLSYYATDSLSDAAGAFTGVVLGGMDFSQATDTQGPDISMFLDDYRFVSGNLTSSQPLLLVNLSDSSGINPGDLGIGKNITAWLDDDTRNAVDLSPTYQALNMTGTRGKIIYRLKKLESGTHTLSLRAWDLQDNSSVKTITFTVNDGQAITLRNVTNYPNPFSDRTWFTFEHDQPGSNLIVTIEIFNLQGQLLKTIRTNFSTSDYGINPIEWDGRADNGRKLPAGIYPYRIQVENPAGTVRVQYQKLIINR
ncbi:MAG: type IX secretion system sortase PorU [Bacteroidales bacterium]